MPGRVEPALETRLAGVLGAVGAKVEQELRLAIVSDRQVSQIDEQRDRAIVVARADRGDPLARFVPGALLAGGQPLSLGLPLGEEWSFAPFGDRAGRRCESARPFDAAACVRPCWRGCATW